MAASSVCLLSYLSQWCIRRSAHGAFRSATNEWLSPSRAILCSRLCRAADGWAKQCLPGAGATEIALCFHPPSPLLACTAALSPASPCLPAHEHQASTHNACRSSNAPRSERGWSVCSCAALRTKCAQLRTADPFRHAAFEVRRCGQALAATCTAHFRAFLFSGRWRAQSSRLSQMPCSRVQSSRAARSAAFPTVRHGSVGRTPRCASHARKLRRQPVASSGSSATCVRPAALPLSAPFLPFARAGRRRRALEAQLYSAG